MEQLPSRLNIYVYRFFTYIFYPILVVFCLINFEQAAKGAVFLGLVIYALYKKFKIAYWGNFLLIICLGLFLAIMSGLIFQVGARFYGNAYHLDIIGAAILFWFLYEWKKTKPIFYLIDIDNINWNSPVENEQQITNKNKVIINKKFILAIVVLIAIAVIIFVSNYQKNKGNFDSPAASNTVSINADIPVNAKDSNMEVSTLVKNDVSPLIMTDHQLRQVIRDFLAESEKVKHSTELSNWVNNCYAHSTNKKGCFEFDMLVSFIDYSLSETNKNYQPSTFFSYDDVINRALRMVPEFYGMNENMINEVISKNVELIIGNIHLFGEMKAIQQVRLHQKNLQYYNGLAKFEQNGLWGFIDKKGNIAIAPQFSYVGRFSRERAAVQVQNGLWGFINKQGQYVVTPSFCTVGAFSETDGLAGVYYGGYRSGNQCLGGKWGFIDVNGNWVISELDYAEKFVKGKAKVTYKGYTGYIDRYGNWVN